MGLPDSVQVSRDWTYSGTNLETSGFRLPDCHRLWCRFPSTSSSHQFCDSRVADPTTPQAQGSRFGLFPFRSPLLRKSRFLSFPPGTEMFQFPGLASHAYLIQHTIIQAPWDQRLFGNSPKLFAAYHALLRLLSPRHPPHALCNLTTMIYNSPLRAETLQCVDGHTSLLAR